jgi:fumarate reductase subunit D
MKALQYIKRRLNERSTWLLIGAGIAGAAALVWPWSLVAAVVAVIGALVPDGDMKPGDDQ